MKTTVLVINPNPLLNLVHRGDFKAGAVHRVTGLELVAEGKGVNLARVLARHGHEVLITGFAGGHSGAWLRERVRAEGIHGDWVETVAPLRVGFMAASSNASHPTIVLPGGFPVSQEECQTLLECVDGMLPRVGLVIVSGSVPDPVADDLYEKVLFLCARHRVPCWMDAYGRAMQRSLMAPVPPQLATPNREEFEQCQAWERVAELHVTDGAGAVAVSGAREGRWQVLPPVIRQVNPIGSGDCYLAGLAHGWLSGLSYADSLRYAAAAGAANAMRQDVAMIGPADIEPLLGLAVAERLEVGQGSPLPGSCAGGVGQGGAVS